MINLDTIEMEIQELEARGETTYSQCERLAWLYVVRDHLKPTSEKQSEPIRGSEFLEVATALPYGVVMRIMNEHMEAVKVVQPREYEAVMAKLGNA